MDRRDDIAKGIGDAAHPLRGQRFAMRVFSSQGIVARSPRLRSSRSFRKHVRDPGLGQIGKGFAQARDHRRARQAKERVDPALDVERGDDGVAGS
jgi:hypothetical protein